MHTSTEPLVDYKRRLIRWQRENRLNIAEFKRRVDQYKKRTTYFHAKQREIHKRHEESIRSINTRYEKLIKGAISLKRSHELDIERRSTIADAIRMRDKSLSDLGTPPTYPEFHITEGRPDRPMVL